ncbi:hypothetical protein D9M68_934810 [compost metagenome]
MREGLEAAFRRGNADLLEQFDRAALCRLAVHALVLPERLGKLEADGEAWVQAGARLLEDHRHVFARELAALPGGHGQEVAAVEAQLVGADAAGIADKAHQREHGD